MIRNHSAYERAVSARTSSTPPNRYHWQHVRRLVAVPGLPEWFAHATTLVAAHDSANSRWLLLGERNRTPFPNGMFFIGCVLSEACAQAALHDLADLCEADSRPWDGHWSYARPDQYTSPFGPYPAGWPVQAPASVEEVAR
jgi:hypothetical protein